MAMKKKISSFIEEFITGGEEKENVNQNMEDMENSGIEEVFVEEENDNDDIRAYTENIQDKPKEDKFAIANMDKYQMIFVNAKSFSEATKVANYIKQEKMLTLNIEDLDNRTATRLMNFISGAMTVKEATYVPISRKVFTIVPRSMRVYYEGKENLSPKIFSGFGGDGQK